jgi:uncharacterized protein (DUF58 family)
MINDSSSQDPNSLRKQADQEKIFVREYVSGDLARDINWKALARIGSLLTRIPPESPRESKIVRLVVYMPPAGRTPCEQGCALVQLEHIRVIVSSILESIRRAESDYGFSVCLGDAEYNIGAGERFDDFYAELSRAGFSLGPSVKTSLENAQPKKSWIVGSSSDSGLILRTGELISRGNHLILSRMRPVYEYRRTGEAYRVPLLSSFPGAFPSLSLLAVLVSAKSRSVISAGDANLEFDCGVRS